MPTDKENVSFLYSIIRQLETKHVSWKIVAHDNDITNDHAARMRFHRLRQQFEGLTPKKRGPRKNADCKGKCRAEFGDNASDDDDKAKVKSERKRKTCKTEESESEEDALAVHRAKKRTGVKLEPGAPVKREPGAPVKGEPGEGSATAAASAAARGSPVGGAKASSLMAPGGDGAMMRPAKVAFGMAPPHAQGGHYGYRPMVAPGHYRGIDPRLAGPQMHGALMPGPSGLLSGPPGTRPAPPGTRASSPGTRPAPMGSRLAPPMPGGAPMSRMSFSGPPPSGQQPKPRQPVGMSRMSLSGPPPKVGSQVQMQVPRMPHSGTPPPPSPLGQQRMLDRMVARPAVAMPLRPKNVPYERMPPRVEDVPQTAENAGPQMPQASPAAKPPAVQSNGDYNAVNGSPSMVSGNPNVSGKPNGA